MCAALSLQDTPAMPLALPHSGRELQKLGVFFAFDVCRARRIGLVVPGWAEMGSCATDRLEGALGRLDLQGADTSILTPGKQGLHFVM